MSKKKKKSVAGATYALAFHAGFGCRNSTVCCSPGKWNVIAEPAVRDDLKARMQNGTLKVPGRTADDLFIKVVQKDGGSRNVLRGDENGKCVLLQDNLCAVHSQIGPEALPVGCHVFPRIYLQRPTGVFVTFSCYCPTSSAMLFEGGDIRIVANPKGFSLRDGGYRVPRRNQGPRLTPEIPLGWDEYDRWERLAVDTLANDRLSPEMALLALGTTVEAMRAQAGVQTFDGVPVTPEAAQLEKVATSLSGGLSRARRHFSAILGHSDTTLVLNDPKEFFVARYGMGAGQSGGERLAADHDRYVAENWPRFGLPLRRFLASKLFANEFAHHTEGLRSTLFTGVCALLCARIFATVLCAQRQVALDEAVLSEALQRTDFLMLHGSTISNMCSYLSRSEYVSAADLYGPAFP